MNSVQRAIVLSAVERYASLVVFFVATAILSRLLTPMEFGTFAVVNALTMVITASFQEFGGANYLIQKHDLSRASVRTAFTITLGISMLIGIVLFAFAGVLSRFFEQESLTNGIAVSTLNFLLLPFSGTVSALFRREMEFGKLAICNLAGNSAGAVVSIALALCNFSYMAPVWGNVATNVILTATLLAFYRDFGVFRPSLRERHDIIGFGLYSGGVSIINVFYNLAPQLFLAKILDFASVGLYSRAINITQTFDKLVLHVLSPVIMPAIVAQRRAGADLKRVYLDAMQSLAVVQWPFMAFVAIMAEPIILIWLGRNWLEIVPLVRLLCVASMALFAACLSYPVLVASNNVRDALVSSFISLPPSLLVILIASFFGVQAVAACALLTLPFQAVVAIYFIGRRLDLGPGDIVRATFKSGIVTLLSSAGAAICALMIKQGLLQPIVGLGLAGVSTAVCWLLSMAVTEHPLLPRLHLAVSGFLHAPALRLAGHATKSE